MRPSREKAGRLVEATAYPRGRGDRPLLHHHLHCLKLRKPTDGPTASHAPPAHATSSGSPLDSRWKVRSCCSRSPLRRHVLTLFARCGLLRRGAASGAPLAAEADLEEGRGRHHRHRRLLGGRGATSHGEEVIDLRFLSPGGEGRGRETSMADIGPETLCGALIGSLTCRKRGCLSGWGFKIHLAGGCSFVSARRDSSCR